MIVIIIAFIFSFLLITEKKRGVDVFCRAYYSQESESGNYTMSSSFIFNFKENGTARISIDGIVKLYDNTYFVSRNLDINYKHIEKNIYKLSNSVIFKSGRDSLPNELFEKNIFSFSESSDQFFTINKMDNVWLIGNLHSPGFICRSTY